MYCTVGLVVLINLFVHGDCTGLIPWNMNVLCGAEISNYLFAGEVYFDAEKLHNNDSGDDCQITVAPAKLNAYGGNMVMFYFTTFEFQSGCDAINVTITDGRRRTDSIVQGLPRYLCGINSTLTEQVFSTTGETFHIHVSIKNRRENYRGHFRLTFVTYYTGSCDESNVYACSNGRCIPHDYSCSKDINACGEVDENCSEETTEETLEDWFSRTIRYLFIIVGGVCIICVLKAFAKHCKRKYGDDGRCIEGCFRDVRLTCDNCCRSVKLSRFPKPRLPNFIRRRLRPDTQETPDESTDDGSPTEAVVNPAYSYSSDQIHVDQIIIQSPPRSTELPQSVTSQNAPPSYDEAMASSAHSFSSLQVEDPSPAYEEVISSNELYSLHTEDPCPSYEEVIFSNEIYSLQAEDPSPDYEGTISSNELTSSIQSEEYSYTEEENNINNNNSIDISEADDTDCDTRERILTSNMIILSSLNTDTSSILDNYLCDFAVELSDGYSTDPDWDSQSNSSVLSQDETVATQSVISANNEPNEEVRVPPPTDDGADPAPYYYDYIANVGRYKQDSVTES